MAQGLRVGTLDNIISDAFIYHGNAQNNRLKSFGELETQFFEVDSWKRLFERNKELGIDNKGKAHIFEYFFTLFADNEGFHPKTRPVLWRMLIAQAYLYQALIQVRKNNDLLPTSFDEFKKGVQIDLDHLKWDDHISNEELNQSFLPIEKYLNEQLVPVFEICQKEHDRIKLENTKS